MRCNASIKLIGSGCWHGKASSILNCDHVMMATILIFLALRKDFSCTDVGEGSCEIIGDHHIGDVFVSVPCNYFVENSTALPMLSSLWGKQWKLQFFFQCLIMTFFSFFCLKRFMSNLPTLNSIHSPPQHYRYICLYLKSNIIVVWMRLFFFCFFCSVNILLMFG